MIKIKITSLVNTLEIFLGGSLSWFNCSGTSVKDTVYLERSYLLSPSSAMQMLLINIMFMQIQNKSVLLAHKKLIYIQT